MGIQINGQTDIISATDGSLTVSGADLGNASASNLNISGIVTATEFSGNVTGNVTGNLTGTASTATAAATAYGLSGSPTLSGITSVSTTNLTVNGNAYPSDGVISGARNRIINGDMRIDQRNAGASVTLDGSGVYPVDRWRCDESSDGGATGEQVQDAPTGFVDSLKITTTTADGSLSSNQYMAANHFIEGFNTADFGWGTANAKTVTLSFWVKSSLTGTFAGGVDNNASDRSYVFNYTISVADTWEYKTVYISGDTIGTWNTGNARGISLRFSLGSGTTWEGTVGSWQSGAKFASSGAVSVIGTLNATWYITGVQLEAGTVATPFERRSYGQELALCQRYYYKTTPGIGAMFGNGFAYNTTSAIVVINFNVPMRVAVNQLDTSGIASYYSCIIAGTTQICTSVPIYGGDPSADRQTVNFRYTGATLTAGQGIIGRSNNNTAFLAWSAEL